MAYLIDNDWVADFLAGRQPAIDLVRLVRALLADGLAMSVVSYIEIVEGIRVAATAKRWNRVSANFFKPSTSWS